MEVRVLQRDEILPALHLVWEVFAQDVAPGYSPEGVAKFQEFIKYENITGLYDQQGIQFFGAFSDRQLCGIMAVKSGGHISLFFVKKSFQGRGIGRQLFQMACNYCAQQPGIRRITVNAAPGAAAQYAHLGMHATAAEQEEDGIRYVPMELWLSPQSMAPAAGKSKKTVLIAAIAAGILFLGVLLFAGFRLVSNLYQQNRIQTEESIDNLPGNSAGEKDEDDTNEDGLTGIAAIPEYRGENLSYEIQDETYHFEDDEKTSTLIQFEVAYPSIQGLSGEVSDKVNGALKDCAMKNVDEIYTHPSEEFKEKVLGADQPVLASFVQYKVTYAGEDFVSVIFEDYSYQGSQEDYHQDIRTVNISLKDGTVYEVKDIVKLNAAFLKEWLKVMRSETGNDAFLSELTEEDMKKTLSGDSLDGVYCVNFFLDADGIEIGYDLNYPANDSHNLGYLWVTAPFTMDEIRTYKSDSGLWDLIESDN